MGVINTIIIISIIALILWSIVLYLLCKASGNITKMEENKIQKEKGVTITKSPPYNPPK